MKTMTENQIQARAKLSSLDRFIYWVKERHSIYLKRKSGGSKPWTDDPILQSYFFTNPYRENDKTTMWFRENVRDPLSDDDQVVFATVCFRWFNYIPTGQILLAHKLFTNWDVNYCIRLLEKAVHANEKVFTGAFNISAGGSTKPKLRRVCQDYIQPVWKDRGNLRRFFGKGNNHTMQEAHKFLQQYPGLGGSGFMAYEIVCDLRYTNVLSRASDKLTWSNPGPGAKRGLNRILNEPVENAVSKSEWARESPHLLDCLRELKGMPPFEMREVEHSLCEFDKYERARLNSGHLKRRYNGS